MIRPTNLWRSRLASGFLAVAGPLLFAGNAQAAEVFKCTTSSGKVEFTDAPCSTSQKSAVVDARPNSLDNSAVREQLLRIENRALQEKLAATQPAPATPLQGQIEFARSDSAACRSAKRDVEVAATSVENNKALIRTRQSAMYVACGVREPDKQIINVNNRHERGDLPYVDPRTSTR